MLLHQHFHLLSLVNDTTNTVTLRLQWSTPALSTNTITEGTPGGVNIKQPGWTNSVDGVTNGSPAAVATDTSRWF